MVFASAAAAPVPLRDEEGAAAALCALCVGAAARTCAEPFLRSEVPPGGEGSAHDRLHAPDGTAAPRAPSDGRSAGQLELERLLASSVPVPVRGKPHAVARGAELAEACRRPGGPSPRAGGAAVHHGDSPASLNASLPSAALFLCSVQPVLSPANGGRALRVRLGRDRRSNRGRMAAVKPLSWCAAARRVGHEARHFSLCCVLRLLRKQRLVKCPNLAGFSTQLPKALCCRATAPPEATRSRRSRLARLSAPPCASKYHYGSVFRREAKRARRNH